MSEDSTICRANAPGPSICPFHLSSLITDSIDRQCFRIYISAATQHCKTSFSVLPGFILVSLSPILPLLLYISSNLPTNCARLTRSIVWMRIFSLSTSKCAINLLAPYWFWHLVDHLWCGKLRFMASAWLYDCWKNNFRQVAVKMQTALSSLKNCVSIQTGLCKILTRQRLT